MAYSISNSPMIGTIGNLTYYKIKGSDKVYVRTKGGPSKQRVKTSSQYENTRRNNAEFGGRSTCAKWLLRNMRPLKHVGNRNLLAGLNSLLKPVQLLDNTSSWGKRHVLISSNPRFLEGFNLNRVQSLESILRPGLAGELSKETMSAKLSIPALLPGFDIYNPGRQPWYRISAVLALIPDILYIDGRYEPAPGFIEASYISQETTWFAANEGSAACQLKLSLPIDNTSIGNLMLVAGISFGMQKTMNYIQPIKQEGAAKIIGMI